MLWFLTIILLCFGAVYSNTCQDSPKSVPGASVAVECKNKNNGHLELSQISNPTNKIAQLLDHKATRQITPSQLPPNPFYPPFTFPPNPFRPAPFSVPPNPNFQPPTSRFPPFFPSPPVSNSPPIPGLVPFPPPPPVQAFRFPFPPFPFQPTPGFPGDPPAQASSSP